MTTYHEAVAALPVATAAVKAALRAEIIKRQPYVLADSDDLQTITVVDPDAGTIPLAVAQLGKLFQYDSTDTTTAHDGTTCLVSADGKRYKIDTFTGYPFSVLDKDLTAPPGSPSVGDAYIVGTASTGAWSGKDAKIAVYTARGWVFCTIPIGKLEYVVDETAFYHRNAGGTWTRGVASLAFGADAIAISSLIGKPVRHIVVNQTTNAPPGSPTTGVAYIVGPSPSGAWSGHAGKLAICEDGSSFTIYTPRTGELAYDANLAADVRYSGSAWVAGSDGFVLLQTQVASASATIDFTTHLDDTYDGYELVMTNVKPATDDVQLLLQVGTGAGPTYQTANYQWTSHYSGVASATTVGVDGSTAIQLGPDGGGGNGVGSGAGRHLSGRLRFQNPESTDYPIFAYDGVYVPATFGPMIRTAGGGVYKVGVAITALRLKFASGNIAAGRFSLYGLRKS